MNDNVIDMNLLAVLLPDAFPNLKDRAQADNNSVPVEKKAAFSFYRNEQEYSLPNQETKSLTSNSAPIKEQQRVNHSTSKNTYHRENGEPLESYLRRNHADLFYAGIIQSGITDEREIVERSRTGYLEKGRAGRYYNLPQVKRERERVLAVLAGSFE